nr:uncharacterized protein LOC128687332 [Cherax quadricarinatus]
MIYNPGTQQLSPFSSQVQAVKIVSSVTRGGEAQTREAATLAGLQITGVRVREKHPWGHYPKEDSESRARRYLVKVEQHLRARRKPQEAPRKTKVTAITSSNQITSARTPVAAQRDQRKNRAERQSERLLWRRGQSWQSRQSRLNFFNQRHNHIQERESTAALCEVLFVQNSGLCVQRVAPPPIYRTHPHSPVLPKSVQTCAEIPAPQTCQPEPEQPAYPQQLDPRTLFSVTIRTASTQQQPSGQNCNKQPCSRLPSAGQQSSCAHVSTVRESLSSPDRATCLPTTTRSLQSLPGRTNNHSSQSDSSRRWYIAPSTTHARQLHTQSRTGYTCSPDTSAPEPSLVKVGSASVQ